MSEQTQTAVAPVLTAEESHYRLLERQAAGLAKAKGGMVPRAYQGQPGDILAAFLMAQTYNIDPFAMMRGTYFVNGKPTMSGDLMLAIAYQNGCKVVETYGENEQIGVYASCSVWRASERDNDTPTTTVIFSQDDAVQAGLWEGNDVWKKYPKRMLTMRARGFAIRNAIPDCLAGVYIEGEIPGDPIDITPEVEE